MFVQMLAGQVDEEDRILEKFVREHPILKTFKPPQLDGEVDSDEEVDNPKHACGCVDEVWILVFSW